MDVVRGTLQIAFGFLTEEPVKILRKVLSFFALFQALNFLDIGFFTGFLTEDIKPRVHIQF